jgi:hypothetical protein
VADLSWEVETPVQRLIFVVARSSHQRVHITFGYGLSSLVFLG